MDFSKNMHIQFPINNGQRYYKIHYEFVHRVFEAGSAQIELKQIPMVNTSNFKCKIDGKDVIFCFSDDNNSFGINDPELNNIPVFKFHYGQGNLFGNNVFPFSPISFHNWNEYYEMEKEINYQCSGVILNNQRAYGGAVDRRNNVRGILFKEFGSRVDFSLTDQKSYWRKINSALVSIHVPGFCNNMLDRAQLQMMAFGCCTISPYLYEIVPYGAEDGSKPMSLQPWLHYIRCKDDYSDLVEKIKWCESNKNKCVEIGQNAKRAFLHFLTPWNLCRDINSIVNI